MSTDSSSHQGLTQLGQLDKASLFSVLFQCCSSTKFANQMVAAAPFTDHATLLSAARVAEASMSPDDWLEAFSHHPRIGDKAALAKKMEGAEQAGMHAASEDVVDRMYLANMLYEERFGHIYLVCATGKSADELLAILEDRLSNHPDEEFRIACAEQQKITDLRLGKLVDSGS